jgi:hypothetical protein
MTKTKSASATKKSTAKTSASKGTNRSNAALGNANLAKASKDAAQEAQPGRAGTHLYPADCTTSEQRKAHRRKVRKALRDFQASLEKLQGKERKEKEQELTAYIKAHFAEGAKTILDKEPEPAVA